jgi:hypothetical protein
MEGVDVELAGGWEATDSAVHQIVFAALPDDHTVVGLQYCRTAARRTYIAEVQGLHLNVANDLFNGFHRSITTASQQTILASPPPRDESLKLDSRWLNIDSCIGVMGLYGAESLFIGRSLERRGGPFGSLYVEEVGWPIWRGCISADPESVILDVGWLVSSGINEGQTRTWVSANQAARLETGVGDVRGVRVTGVDGRRYTVVANFGKKSKRVVCGKGTDLVTRRKYGAGDAVFIKASQARIFL